MLSISTLILFLFRLLFMSLYEFRHTEMLKNCLACRAGAAQVVLLRSSQHSIQLLFAATAGNLFFHLWIPQTRGDPVHSQGQLPE